MENYLGQILPVAFPFAPQDTAATNGQMIPINQNSALFSLLGTTYGGDGRTTFALPDTQGRTIVGSASGGGMSAPPIGAIGGEASHTLTATEIPPHVHSLNATTQGTAAVQPGGRLPGTAIAGVPAYGPMPSNTVMLRPATIGVTGGGQPHPNMQPSLPITFAIVIAGVFPTRQ